MNFELFDTTKWRVIVLIESEDKKSFLFGIIIESHIYNSAMHKIKQTHQECNLVFKCVGETPQTKASSWICTRRVRHGIRLFKNYPFFRPTLRHKSNLLLSKLCQNERNLVYLVVEKIASGMYELNHLVHNESNIIEMAHSVNCVRNASDMSVIEDYTTKKKYHLKK